MSGVNKVIILGRVGKDPEVRHLPDGGLVTSVSVATSERYKDKGGGDKEVTEWHRVVIFGKIAEVVQQYVSKGDQLYIEGALKTNKWTDNNGVERHKTEIVAKSVQLIGGKKEKASGITPQEVNNIDDDIPF